MSEQLTIFDQPIETNPRPVVFTPPQRKTYVLRDYQKAASNAAVNFFTGKLGDGNALIVCPTGCHAKGYEVLMYDGTLRKVEDVRVGDLLMGDDSTPRTVLDLHRGIDDMFRITPIKGEPFVVNGGHILSLYKTNEGKPQPSCAPRIDEISVYDYILTSANYKHLHKLYHAKQLDFGKKYELPLPPYFLGVYIGDGGSSNGSVGITTQRAEVANAMEKVAHLYGLNIRIAKKNHGLNKAVTLFFSGSKKKKNIIAQKLEEIGLFRKLSGEKFIPYLYKTASYADRMELLAGLLDTDAFYNKECNTFEYSTKSYQLARDMQFLCRSLGYHCGHSVKVINGTTYYRMQISGDFSKVNCRTGIRTGRERLQKKSLYVTGFSVEPIGKGEYYGFTLDGNHLYCDWQLFVHHNSGKSLIIADIATRLEGKLLVFQPSKEILEQNFAKYRSYGFYDCAVYSASMNSKKRARVTFATIGSVMSHPELFDAYEHVIVDECHLTNAKGGRYKDFFEMGDRRILGLTATPYRLVSYEQGCILKFLTRTRPRIFSKLIYQVPIQTLMSRGYLARLRYFDMQLIDLSGVKRNSTGQDYDEASLRRAYEMQDLNGKLVEVVNRLRAPKDGSKRHGILVFTRFIEESEWLVKQLGSCAEIVTGDTPKKERERVLRDFKSGKLEIVANVNCLDENTEILTRQGWVGIDAIADQDVAQYDNGVITFAKADKIIKNDGYSDDFISVNGRYLNIRVTKNHRMLYAKRQRGGDYAERIDYAENIVGKSNIFIPVSGYAREDVFETPAAAVNATEKRFVNYNAYNYRKKGYSREEADVMAKQLYERRLKQRAKAPHELTLDECQFIGFFLGDGSISSDAKGGKKYSFVQSLSTPKMCEWVECLLKKCGINYSEETRTPSSRIVMGRECLVSDYKKYTLYLGTGGDKQYVPSNLYKLIPYLEKDGNDMLWGLNREQFFALTDGLFKANGEHGNNKDYKGGERFIVSNKRLADLLQAIGTCRGFRVIVSTRVRGDYKPLYYLSVSDHRYHEMVNETLQLEQHDRAERTWCVSVPTGKIITRRNGRVAIMGNCLTTGFDYPELDTIVMARPTMSLAMYYQIVGRGIRPSEGKNGWFVDMCGNVGRFGKVDDLELMEETPGRGTWCVYGRVSGERKQLTNIFF